MHERAQDDLRRRLGLRPETRLDCIIFPSGEAYEMQPGDTLLLVRTGAMGDGR